MQTLFAESFAATLKALAPIETIGSLMQELEARGAEVSAFKRRQPQFAQVVGNAWGNVLKQVANSLTPGVSAPVR